MNRLPTAGFLALVILLVFAPVHASELVADSYACVLNGASVFPPDPSPIFSGGRVNLFLSASNELSYNMYECAGLGSIEAHIHGPATAGAIGPIIFTIPPAGTPNEFTERSGVLGVLDAQQVRDLNCGLWYADIHTSEHPLGVVRGQLRGLWGWDPGSPCFLATEASTWGAVKARYR